MMIQISIPISTLVPIIIMGGNVRILIMEGAGETRIIVVETQIILDLMKMMNQVRLQNELPLTPSSRPRA